MRIGIDLGGTKIEGIALAGDGREVARHRVPTPREDYPGTLRAIAGVVHRLEEETGARGTVGLGMPGSVSPSTGLVRNANSVWLIGQPVDRDLAAELDREVRWANDADCLAVSEATDGAGAGARVVFAAILGTGVGAGVVVDGALVAGRNRVGGEWGHNPLPWADGDELPGPACYCDRRGCLETWLSGPALARDHERATGTALAGAEIAAAADRGDPGAEATMQRYVHRLVRGLAHVIHVLDPDVVVLGGGVSNTERLYRAAPALLPEWVFGGEATTPIRRALHGDSSGVRGAAALWPAAP